MCVADYERGGNACAICHQSDHSEEHHRLAAMDLFAQPGQASTLRGGSAAKGSVSPGGTGAGAASPEAQLPSEN